MKKPRETKKSCTTVPLKDSIQRQSCWRYNSCTASPIIPNPAFKLGPAVDTVTV
jgi:hypothetical protein